MASHLKTKLTRSLDYSLLFCIRGYRYVLSYLLGPVCRFQPSCSSYALEAIQVYGSYKGLKLACMRILRCHPWHPGGIDEVPTPTLNLTDRS